MKIQVCITGNAGEPLRYLLQKGDQMTTTEIDQLVVEAEQFLKDTDQEFNDLSTKMKESQKTINRYKALKYCRDACNVLIDLSKGLKLMQKASEEKHK